MLYGSSEEYVIGATWVWGGEELISVAEERTRIEFWFSLPLPEVSIQSMLIDDYAFGVCFELWDTHSTLPLQHITILDHIWTFIICF